MTVDDQWVKKTTQTHFDEEFKNLLAVQSLFRWLSHQMQQIILSTLSVGWKFDNPHLSPKVKVVCYWNSKSLLGMRSLAKFKKEEGLPGFLSAWTKHFRHCSQGLQLPTVIFTSRGGRKEQERVSGVRKLGKSSKWLLCCQNEWRGQRQW